MNSSAKTSLDPFPPEKTDPNQDTQENGPLDAQIKQIEATETDPSIAEIGAPRIAILVDTSREWGRRLVQGVNSYAVKHGPWKLWVATRGPFQAGARDRLNLPANWNGDGIIAPIENDSIAKKLVSYGCPVVNVSAEDSSSLRIPQVTSNVDAVAEISVEHFNHRGLKNFAYVGPLQRPCVQLHAAIFQEKVRSDGFQCHMFDCVYDPAVVERWNVRRAKMADWLRMLPKPIGIFSWQTNAAIQVLDVCSANGISVPDDISVLAGDDDSLLCSTTSPTLSGVVTASEHIGFAAARHLDQLLNGSTNVVQQICELIDPIMVTLRKSTDSLAITDPDLLAAVRYIRMNACRGITVQEVADSVPIGRRSLERKFKDCFGRTPLDEIQRLRLARVRELLVKTDLAIAKIAQDAGFGTPEYMTTMFKCRFGLTPLKFRSQSRAR